MSHPSQSSVHNRLLAALPPEDFAHLQPHLEPFVLNVKDVLVEPNEPIEYVHFIEAGIGSVIAVSTDGQERVEIGHVGWEGMTGNSVILGADRTPHKTFIQVAGTSLRIRARGLQQAMETRPALRSLLLRFVHTVNIQIAETALANGRYSVHERLARWLLMSHDRTEGNDLVLTHEFLSLMLGVRRSGVTNEIHIIEGAGIVKATRGNIRIIDRERLEEIAGGSYGQSEREYDRLIGPPLSRK